MPGAAGSSNGPRRDRVVGLVCAALLNDLIAAASVP